MTSIPGRRGAHVCLNLYFFALFICLTLKSKDIGAEAVRPLYYCGIGLLFAGAIAVVLRIVRSSLSLRLPINLPVVISFVFVNLLMLGRALGMSERHIKDALLGTTVDLLLMFTILGGVILSRWSPSRLVHYFSSFAIFVSVVSCLYALGTYVGWIDISVGGIALSHNPVWGTRMHGHAGEPTHFSGIVGVGLLCAVFRWFEGGRTSRYLPVLILLTLSIVLAGGRNALVSAAVGMAVLAVFDAGLRRKILFFGGAAAAVAIVLVPPLLQIDRIATFLSEVFRIGDEAAFDRLRIWTKAINFLGQSDLFEILFGHGYGFHRTALGGLFNQFLRFMVDLGLLYVALFFGLLVLIVMALLRGALIRETRPAATLGLVVLAYALTFSLFLDVIFAHFFHFAGFMFVMATIIAASCGGDARVPSLFPLPTAAATKGSPTFKA